MTRYWKSFESMAVLLAVASSNSMGRAQEFQFSGDLKFQTSLVSEFQDNSSQQDAKIDYATSISIPSSLDLTFFHPQIAGEPAEFESSRISALDLSSVEKEPLAGQELEEYRTEFQYQPLSLQGPVEIIAKWRSLPFKIGSPDLQNKGLDSKGGFQQIVYLDGHYEHQVWSDFGGVHCGAFLMDAKTPLRTTSLTATEVGSLTVLIPTNGIGSERFVITAGQQLILCDALGSMALQNWFERESLSPPQVGYFGESEIELGKLFR